MPMQTNPATRALGWIHAVLGGIGLAVGLFFCIALLRDPSGSTAGYYVFPIFGFVAVIFLLPMLIGGVGLIQGQAWARIILIILSALFVLVFPVGTLLGGYGLWVLLSEKGQSVDGGVPPASTVPAYDKRFLSGQAGLLVAMAGVASGFVVVIWIGNFLTGGSFPVVSNTMFVLASGVLIWIGVTVARSGFLRVTSHVIQPAPVAPAEESRVAWSKPQGTGSCVHLQPVERAMTALSIVVQRTSPTTASANCQVDQQSLATQFGPGTWALYCEGPRPERSLHDPLQAWFWCDRCQSVLHVVHAESAKLDTPWFPEAPAVLPT